jgi:hypothetical protein
MGERRAGQQPVGHFLEGFNDIGCAGDVDGNGVFLWSERIAQWDAA